MRAGDPWVLNRHSPSRRLQDSIVVRSRSNPPSSSLQRAVGKDPPFWERPRSSRCPLDARNGRLFPVWWNREVFFPDAVVIVGIGHFPRFGSVWAGPFKESFDRHQSGKCSITRFCWWVEWLAGKNKCIKSHKIIKIYLNFNILIVFVSNVC